MTHHKHNGDCGASPEQCQILLADCQESSFADCQDCGREMCEACATGDGKRCWDCWDKQAKRRCMLHVGHGGVHMFIDTHSTSFLPGECTAQEEAA